MWCVCSSCGDAASRQAVRRTHHPAAVLPLTSLCFPCAPAFRSLPCSNASFLPSAFIMGLQPGSKVDAEVGGWTEVVCAGLCWGMLGHVLAVCNGDTPNPFSLDVAPPLSCAILLAPCCADASCSPATLFGYLRFPLPSLNVPHPCPPSPCPALPCVATGGGGSRGRGDHPALPDPVPAGARRGAVSDGRRGGGRQHSQRRLCALITGRAQER